MRRAFDMSGLGCGLHWYKFVAALGGLLVESGFEPLFAHQVAFCPKRGIVFHLSLDHRVENDGDLVRRRGRTGGRTYLRFHSAEVISDRYVQSQ